ncbi:Integral membrane protein TerC [Thermosinus carboxydivorans Nor1]|uniref:Integral membrane protein TerC n=1 Tax=Thermosinus carboxydivorans Nor1 TaxID=401526 RepID=A1HRP1_9FIRM|nr:TerC family protein [Thermosinus carboxydivorans]EAX47362.1 Integral membrane protein TerC [Thermosinus carboxydivorans Nor1]
MEWSILLSIIMINLILSSDNALAIAMASRGLPSEQRKKAVLWGSIGAVVLQILLTFTASLLLSIPYLKIIGGVMLVWIAAKLFGAEETEVIAQIESWELLPAIIKIMVANLVMSLDNVLAVAAIADGNFTLLGLGLVMSFPVIIWGSAVIVAILEKFPVVSWLGAIFLGWTAGGIISSDCSVAPLLDRYDISRFFFSTIAAALVVMYGVVKDGKAENYRMPE